MISSTTEHPSALAGSSVDHLVQRAVALLQEGHSDAAFDPLRRAQLIAPERADIYSLLGAILAQAGPGFSGPALGALLRSVSLSPDQPLVQSMLARLLSARGLPDAAIPYYARAAEIDPSPNHVSLLLANLLGCDSVSAKDCALEHQRLGALFDQLGAASGQARQWPAPSGRHRIGFVAPDLATPPMTAFLRPLLRALDRSRFDIVFYSGAILPNAFEGLADLWRDTSAVPDDDLARLIAADGIATLIDLAGHSSGNRLTVFARRPAPVQMSWLGYPCTTGLASIDYRLVDWLTDPEGTDDQASETLLRLPGGFVCYEPPDNTPLPVTPADGLVFGCFEDPVAITARNVVLWSRLLQRLPAAQLLLGHERLTDPGLRQTLLERFAACAIASDRLILAEGAAYDRVHIGLASVLHNDPRATCDSLWMGIPVVALAGDRHSARIAAALLARAGLDMLVARSEEDYVAIATRLAEDPRELDALRRNLRVRVASSPLCDAVAFARAFEMAVLDRYDASRTGIASLLVGVSDLLEQYGTAPSEQALAPLRASRNQLAGALLVTPSGASLPLDALIAVSQGLTQTGLKTVLSGQEEMDLLARARQALAQTGDGLARALAAHCLLTAPHALPACPDLADIPDRWLTTIVTLLYEEPIFWSGAGEPLRHLAFVETLTEAVRQVLDRRAGDPAFDPATTLKLVAGGRFVGTYFADQPLTVLSRSRASLMESWLKRTGLALDHDFPPSDRTRLRLGCLRLNWLEGTESASLLAHLRGLDERFEIIVYSYTPLGDSPFEREVTAIAAQICVLPDNLNASVATLRADDLDILLVGQNVTAIPHLPTSLCAFRLARFQVATTVSPSSSGFNHIDAFLNGVLNERDGAQSDYTERLLLAPGSINLYEFHDPAPVDPPDIGRAEMGIGEQEFIFASGANLFKITAELIASWARILQRRPDSALILYPFNPYWAGLYPVVLFERHLRTVLTLAGVDPSRLKLLPQQPSRAHIRAILKRADLYLDSFPYSGAVSILDPLAAGLPMLLYQGQQARCRQSAGMHAEFGLPAVLAESPQSYEDMAVALSNDAARLAGLRAESEPCQARMKAGRLRLADTLFTSFHNR
jgi:predicted O-linked N-acetylglucosamine transferase (SPINDLY family)